MKINVPNMLLPLMLSLFVCCALPTGKPAAAGENGIGVKIMEKEVVGKYLADGNGMTLYRFTKDGNNISHCIEGCAANWPPFYSGLPAGVEGCELSDFAVITREDGRQQMTYKTMPLYYFKNDRYPGDTFGAGLGDAWFLITP